MNAPVVSEPCPFCDGVGRGVDPTAEPDVIEGHKLSPRVRCLACNGRGKTDDPAKAAGFRAYLKAFREEVEAQRSREAVAKLKREFELSAVLYKAERVLSGEEIAMLRERLRREP